MRRSNAQFENDRQNDRQEFQDFKTEMRLSHQNLMAAMARLTARIEHSDPGGSKALEAERRGANPPIEVDENSAGMQSRYRDLNAVIDRNVVVDYCFDRVECPVYDGTTAFKSWLYKCEQYLDINRIPANRMVRSVSFRLEGLALEWHESFMEDKQDRSVSWDEYVRNMSLRFQSDRSIMMVQNMEVSITDDSRCVLHEETNISNLDLQLLDMPLKIVAEFEEMDEVKLDSIIESGKLESEMVERKEEGRLDLYMENLESEMFKLDVSQAVGSMEFLQEMGVVAEISEPCVEFQGRGIKVEFEKLKETANGEMCDLVYHDENKNDGVDCLGGVQANVCYAGHVWPCGVMVLLWLENWKISSITSCSITATVAWNFKRRKKKLQFVRIVLGGKDNSVRMVQSSSKNRILQPPIHEGTGFGRTHWIRKQLADRNRIEKEFREGNWVFLKLHLFGQYTLLQQQSHKMFPKSCDSFQIIMRVGGVAYELNLPSSARIHNVIHVSVLKKCWASASSNPRVTSETPNCLQQEEARSYPEKFVKNGNTSRTMWLTQWRGQSVTDATWECAEEMLIRFPDFAFNS